MRIADGCDECLLSRVEYECRLVSNDEWRIERAVEACGALLEQIKAEPVAAPVIASRVHRLAYRIIGDPDPYAALKEENNRDALKVCRSVGKNLVTFRDRALAAIIANTLDYGSKEHLVTADFIGFFSRQFKEGLTIDQTSEIERRTSRVVYVSDNCGEIVFDRLLIELLKQQGAHVTLAVRGAPILNDATLDEAYALGLDRIVDTLTTTTKPGIAELGLNFDCLTPALADAIDRCSLIIAKGMANYESLSEYRDLPPVAYLMSVKCDPISRDIGAPKGSRVAVLSE